MWGHQATEGPWPGSEPKTDGKPMSAKKATASEPTNTDNRTDGGGGVATAAVTTEPKDAADLDLARATVGRIVHMY